MADLIKLFGDRPHILNVGLELHGYTAVFHLDFIPGFNHSRAVEICCRNVVEEA